MADNRDGLNSTKDVRQISSSNSEELSLLPNEDEQSRMVMVGRASVDVTELREAEEALQKAERKYREIFEYASEGIFQTTLDGKFMTANPALARMLGFDSPQELMRARTDIAQEHYVDPQRRLEFKHLLEAHGLVRDFEFEAYRKDGSKIWLSESVRAVGDEAGCVLYYEGTALDVTERKRAEVTSVAFASLARRLSGARTQLDAGRIIAQTAQDLFRWDACNLDLYNADRDLISPMLNVDTIDGEKAEVTPQNATCKPSARGRRVIELGAELVLRQEPIKFDGDAIPFGDKTRPSASIMAVPIRHASTIIGVLTIQSYALKAYDYSTLKDFEALADHCGEALNRIRAESSLHESEGRYRDLVENSREFICTHDLDGLILSANRAAVEVLGYDPGDYCGKRNFRELLAPEVRDLFDDYLIQIRRDGVASGLMLMLTSSGERRIWEYYNTLRTEGVAAPVVRGMARDITEQKRAERAMSNLRRELQLTMNSMEEGIHRVDLEGNIVFENPAAARMLGWEVAELMGQRGHATIHHTRPDGMPYPQEECPIYATFRDGVPRHVSDEFFWRQDGTSFPVEYTTAPMRNDRNEIVATVVTFRDITERRRAEEALRASERRYRDIFTFAPVGIYQSLRNGTLTTVNKALAEMLAYDSANEFLKVNLSDVYFDPDEREKLIGEFEDRGYAADLEIQWKRKDGAPIWVQLSAHAIKGVNGTTEYFEGFVRDVNDRKRTEAALRASEERYRELFDNARDAIYVHDLSGRYTSVNRAAEELSGYRREEIIGRHYSNFVAPSHLKYARESFCQKLDETLETNYEAEIISKNGRRTPVEISSRMIYENGVPVGVQGTARDISERKQTQEALRIYSRALIEAQENERQNIARELHDEIGQVLTAVRINLEAIRGSWQTDACLPHIEDSIAVVNEALVQVRELSLDLRPSQLDSLGLSAALRWYVDRYAQRTGIAADVRSIPRDQRLRREVETACFRIVQEALTNVARHAKATRVTVHLKKLRGNLMLSVKDNGVGFDHEILRKSSPARLGLLGMEERAHSVGGSIEISSEALKGTQIRAAFPLEVGSDAQQQKRPVVIKTSGRNLKNVEPPQT